MRSSYTLTILLLTCFMFSNALNLKETSKLRDDRLSLNPDQVLVADRDREDFLLSTNKIYKLVNQKDGNLVLYNVENKSSPKALWNTKTYNLGFNLPTRLILQKRDGNLVLYDRDGKVMWASNTRIMSSLVAYLFMQDDGNLVLYNNRSQNDPQWSTGTYGGRTNL